MLNTFKTAAELSAYDEFPVLAPGINPQVYLSRNDRPQPFYLICERDTLLVQQYGTARVHFMDSSVRWYDVRPGDVTYVPGGTPHRFVPVTESLVARYKADPAGLEGVAWYCEGCSGELDRVEWDTAQELPQEGYLRACRTFNDHEERRRCVVCGRLHPPVDMARLRWEEIAAELRK
jgi:3-hydroxyanthranilate 3,4-dioxygenase